MFCGHVSSNKQLILCGLIQVLAVCACTIPIVYFLVIITLKVILMFAWCTGVENQQHYAAYEEALKGGLSLTLRYLKFLFFGPPRSGKTSTRRRLVREIVNLSQLIGPSVSTGVAETNDVIIKKLTSEPAAIAGSQWWSMKKSKEGTQLDMYSEGDLDYLAQLFYRLIYKNAAPASTNEPAPVQDNSDQLATKDSETTGHSNLSIVPASTTDHKVENTEVKVQVEEDTDLEILTRISDSEELEIQNAFEKLTTILQSDSPEDLKRLLEELTMINMTDVGGQPAFLDMLPALTIGPALYFLFFRLDQDFRTHYPVRFHPAESKSEITLQSSYCIEEVLYQCLASIACFSCHQHAASATKPQVASSHALLFGTYKDRVNEVQISQIEQTLEEHFNGTKLHQEGLLLKSVHGKMVTTVDNMFGTDKSEMSDIRRDIEGIIKSYFPAIPIPVSWLMFRIVLHLLNKPIVSLAQCEEIAKQLSMTSPVQEALWFFHHDIGSLMHYSKIPSMENIIICDPQVIFDSISKLIIDKFQHGNRALKPGEINEFQQKGLFTLSHIQDTTEHPQSSLLKLEQLVDLLKQLNVLAEVKQHEEDNQSEPKFIMPAVMKYASEDELVPPSSTSALLEKQASPLIIHFEGGFVPFGVFCAGIAHLIAHQDSMSPKWQLYGDEVRRNKVKFLIDGAFFATFTSRPQYIMVHVVQHPKAICKSTLEAICSAVRQTIVRTLETVISKMKYKPYESVLVSSKQPFELAFTCCLEDSHSDHFMTVAKDDSGYHAKCLKSHIAFYLNNTHLIWFKVRSLCQSDTKFTIILSYIHC